MRVRKSQPGGSSVHVPVPLGSEDESVRRRIGHMVAKYVQKVLGVDDDEAEVEPSNEDGAYSMQSVIMGMDWEMANTPGCDEDMALEAAQENLDEDPDHYRKKDAYAHWTSDDIDKDTTDGSNEMGSDGLAIDLGSGVVREPGHIGFDLYPYDYGTVVHDLNMGIPLPDGSVSKVVMKDALEYMDMKDPKPLLSEIQRVLMPGGQFDYQGPNQLTNAPPYMKEITDGKVEKIEGVEGAPVQQRFTRLVQPDAATADDAEPRIGIAQYDMLPADALLAMDALGYQSSDATSSGKGNRAAGYPSQGAVVGKGGVSKAPLSSKGRKQVKAFALPEQRKYPIHDLSHARNALARSSGKPEEAKVRAAVYAMYPSLDGVHKGFQPGKQCQIFKIAPMKQVVYGVILTPDEVDLQQDFMSADDIEKSAHAYMVKSRTVGKLHEQPIKADVVESYIAPVDFKFEGGQYGPQVVKKGSWVLGVRVNDPKEWLKVVEGDYQGFSVGGLGLRDKV